MVRHRLREWARYRTRRKKWQPKSPYHTQGGWPQGRRIGCGDGGYWPEAAYQKSRCGKEKRAFRVVSCAGQERQLKAITHV